MRIDFYWKTSFFHSSLQNFQHPLFFQTVFLIRGSSDITLEGLPAYFSSFQTQLMFFCCFTLSSLFLRKMLCTRYGPVGTRFL